MVEYLKKSIVLLFLSLALIFTYSSSYAEENLQLFGESAVLIDYDSLEILYGKNPHDKLPPASTSQMMTAILALENGNLEDVITIDKDVVDMTEGNNIELEVGEELTLKELLDALLIESANDAANAIAKHVSGSVSSFVSLMNKKAYTLGALNTNFTNPTGFQEEENLSTAFDLAIIAKYAMEDEDFADIVKNHKGTIAATNKKSQERELSSSNKLLYSDEEIIVDGEYVPIAFKGVNGVKNGYTSDSQFCFVSSLERDGQKFIAVSLKSNRENIYSDIHKLFNYGLNNFTKTKVGFAGKFLDNFNIKQGVTPFVPAITKTDSFSIIIPSKTDNIEEVVVPNKDLKAPIAQNEVIGRVKYVLDGQVLAEADVVAAMDIRAVKAPTLFKKLMDKWYFVLLFAFILFRILAIFNRRRKKVKRMRRNKRRTTTTRVRRPPKN